MEQRSESRPHPFWLAAGTGLVGVSLGAAAVLMGTQERVLRENRSAEAPVAVTTPVSALPVVEPQPTVSAPSLVDAVARTRDAVVNLGTERTLGAGVIVEESGIVVTNYHVIADALTAPAPFAAASEQTPTVAARFEDGRRLSATVLVADSVEDLAILRLVPEHAGERFSSVTLGESSTLAVGQEVFAIGNPFGLNHSVCRGIISALDRTEVLRNRKLPLIQLDASVNLGNSGGPLFALDGSLVGIVTLRRQDAEGIAFAVPVDHVRGFLRAVSDPDAPRRSGEIGVEIIAGRADEPEAGYTAWLRISKVLPEGPAERAGLRPEDRIVEIRGKRLDGLPQSGSVNALAVHLVSTVRSMFPGERLPLTVLRDGKTTSVELEIAAAPSDRQVAIDAEDLLGLRLRAGPGVPVIDAAVPGTPFNELGRDLSGLQLIRLVDAEIGSLEDLGAELSTLKQVVRRSHGPVRVRVGLREPSREISRDFLVLIE